MHPVLVFGLLGSFLWFLGIAVSAKRTVPVALLYAVAGLALWFALLFFFNTIPKALPFLDLPFLAFFGMQYFVLFGIVPASLLAVFVSPWLKRAMTDPSTRLGRFGARAAIDPSVAVKRTLSPADRRNFGAGLLVLALLTAAFRFIALPAAMRSSLEQSRAAGSLAHIDSLNTLVTLQASLDGLAALLAIAGVVVLWRSALTPREQNESSRPPGDA